MNEKIFSESPLDEEELRKQLILAAKRNVENRKVNDNIKKAPKTF